MLLLLLLSLLLLSLLSLGFWRSFVTLFLLLVDWVYGVEKI